MTSTMKEGVIKTLEVLNRKVRVLDEERDTKQDESKEHEALSIKINVLNEVIRDITKLLK